MEQVSLSAEPRSETGTRAARRLREAGAVPAIVYGRGLDARNIAVDRRELYTVLHTEAGTNALIDLDVDGDSYLTVAREVQRHPVRGDITHLDFIQISLEEKISAEVGIEFMGTPSGVREGEGVVETVRASVFINALPMNIPSSIPLQIGQMEVGDTLTIGDLPRIEDVTYEGDPEAAVVTVLIPRMEIVEPEPEPELLEGVEPELVGDEEREVEGDEEAAASDEGEAEAEEEG